MSLHGVARYALETHAPTCVSRIHKTHACMCVCVCVYPGRRGQNVEERKEQSGRLETSLGLLWSANLLYLLHLPLPPSLSFSVASRGVCGCREQLVVEKHPRSLATPCIARASLSLPLPFLLVLRRSSYDTPATTVLKAILRLLWTHKRSGPRVISLCIVNRVAHDTSPCPVLLFHPCKPFSYTREKWKGEREREGWERKRKG